MSKIDRYEVHNEAGLVVVWRRGSLQLSVSRMGLVHVRSVARIDAWVNETELGRLVRLDPLYALGRVWLRHLRGEEPAPSLDDEEAIYDRARAQADDARKV